MTQSLKGLEVDRGIFAAAVDLDVELDPVTFIEGGHSSPLDRRDVDEGVRLAIVPADESEALHRVEELDRALGGFAGQLALRGRFTRLAHDLERLALDLKIGCRNATAAIDQCKAQRLAVGQIGQARPLDRRDVDEYVLAAVVTDDEAETFLGIEELYDALALADDLGRHSATRAAATKAAAAIAAAEAAAIAKATAAAATAAVAAATAGAEATAIAKSTTVSGTRIKSAELVAAETFTLVTPATTAVTLAPSIETHARSNSLRAHSFI
jgi:hypothetical protein